MKAWYMNGAGNDFMVMDARNLSMDLSALAIRACALTGADGFLAVDYSQIADFKLHFYNSNGLRGEMCGNGARCICRFAYDHGIAPESMVVETDAGLIYAQRLSQCHYRILLNTPGVLDMNRKDGIAYVELGKPGIPHCVTHIPNLRWEQKEALRAYAREIRWDSAFPKGVNVNLYDWIDTSTIRILTYERGVEDYTLACGTGSASTAVVLWLQGKLPTGKLQVENPGGTLGITVAGENGNVTRLTLEGPTEIVGQYHLHTLVGTGVLDGLFAARRTP